MQNIAANIILKFGGAYTLAKIIDIDVTQIYRWTYPKDKGGTNGVIPTKHQQTLLTKAKEFGVDVKPEDFFAVESSLNLPKKVKPKPTN